MKFIQLIRPQYFYQWVSILLFICILASSWSAYNNLRANLSEELIITEKNISSYSNIEIIPNDKDDDSFPEVRFKEKMGTAQLGITLPKRVKTGVLEITIDPSVALFKNFIYLRVITSGYVHSQGSENSLHPKSDRSLGLKSNRWLPLRPDNHVYRIPLNRDSVKPHLILDIKYSGNLSGIPIKSISVKPASFWESPAAAILICLAVAIITFLPGFLISLFWPRAVFLPLSINSFLITLLLNISSLLLGKLFNIEFLIFPTIVILTMGLLSLIPKIRRKFVHSFKVSWASNLFDINILFAMIAGITLCLSFGYPAPVYNIHQGHITSEHTFKAFTAHDSLFQFANAQAILDDDFGKYYGNREEPKLLFLQQDREILPGLSYAATIVSLENLFGTERARQYFPYAFYFLICHGLLLSAIAAWIKPLNTTVSYVTVFFIATTPVFWVLAMVGWFKLTGGAFVLAGILLIREHPSNILRWIGAGLLFGLAKNYHGGNAMALPIITLWMLFTTYKTTRNVSLVKLAVMFVSVTAATCLLVFPWNFYVKQVWNVGTHLMFSMHYLNGNHNDQSLLASIVAFVKQVPLSEQIGVRIDRLLFLFDFGWLRDAYAQYALKSGGFIIGWLNFSSSFFIPAILPYLTLWGCITVVIRGAVQKQPADTFAPDSWFSQFGWVCFLNILFQSFISYGPLNYRTDINWELPTLLIFGVIVNLICSTCHAHKNSYIVWLCAAFMQLGIFIIHA